VVRRKIDEWYRFCDEEVAGKARDDDRSVACWTCDGQTFTRGKLRRLLCSSSKAWNSWTLSLRPVQAYSLRGEGLRLKPGYFIFLRNCDLQHIDFTDYNFISVDFCGSKFNRSNFFNVRFSRAVTMRSRFDNCSFRNCRFFSCELGDASFRHCDFSHAELNGESYGADFSKSKFEKCILSGSYHNGIFEGADFDGAYVFGANFVNTNLSNIANLTRSHVYSPISIDLRTLKLSGKLPKQFHIGAGFSGSDIDKLKDDILRRRKTTVFLSHSSKDERIVSLLAADLEKRGLDVWYAPRDLKIGAKTRTELDTAVSSVDKLIVILSKNSISSDWVEQEVENALEIERKTRKSFLIPVMIDDKVMKSRAGWAAYLRRTKNIGRLSSMKRDESYFKFLHRLLGDITI
jgi:uncharacterized protein YjbI with pentapeptide repeats